MSELSGRELRAARADAYENARPELQASVPPGVTRILDLGCSSGALGAALKASRREAEIVGVERDPAYADVARQRLDRVIEADVEELAAGSALDELGAFDCLIAGDVLEHLRDPWTCLARFAELLAPGGAAIVSVPNVRYWETFWWLARGTWPRRAEGIHDRDHLRWFTVADARTMVEEAGLRVVAVDRQIRLRPGRPSSPAFARVISRTPLRGFFTFQVVIAARRI